MEQWESDLVAEVRDLSRTRFVERAAAIDREGRFPKENIDELRALGVPAMALSKDFGGLDVSVEAQMRIMEETAYGDGSTAVALNMHAIGAGFLQGMPSFPRRDAVLADMGRNGEMICGPGAVPSGGLDTRQAGYRAHEDGDFVVLNGRAGFASGSEGAKYCLIGGVVDRGEGNDPDMALTVPELSTPGITNMMNWDAMGLRGTASHDIVIEDARIPKSEALIISMAMLRVQRKAQPKSQGVNVESQLQARGTLGVLAIWLGLSQAAFDFTIDYVKQRHGYLAAGFNPAGGKAPGYRSEQPWAQFGIGNMEHWLETGRIVLYDTVRRLEQPFATPQEFIRHLVRTVYHLRRMSEEVSQGAMKVCGAHAYVKNRPLERIYRDMVGGNVMAWKTDELMHSLGLSALGQRISFIGPAGT